jgi:hypothetical protein
LSYRFFMINETAIQQRFAALAAADFDIVV